MHNFSRLVDVQRVGRLLSHGMCYSHFGNEVRNGTISITQRGFINDRYKVNPVGQWGKILTMAMGFVNHLGPCLIPQSLTRKN